MQPSLPLGSTSSQHNTTASNTSLGSEHIHTVIKRYFHPPINGHEAAKESAGGRNYHITSFLSLVLLLTVITGSFPIHPRAAQPAHLAFSAADLLVLSERSPGNLPRVTAALRSGEPRLPGWPLRTCLPRHAAQLTQAAAKHARCREAPRTTSSSFLLLFLLLLLFLREGQVLAERPAGEMCAAPAAA